MLRVSNEVAERRSQERLASVRRVSGEVTTEFLLEDAKLFLDMCKITEAHQSSIMQQVFKDKTTTDWPFITQSPSQEQLTSLFEMIYSSAVTEKVPDFCVNVGFRPSWTNLSRPQETRFHPVAHVVVSKENGKVPIFTADLRLGSTPPEPSFEYFLRAVNNSNDTRPWHRFDPIVDKDDLKAYWRMKAKGPQHSEANKEKQ